MKYVVSVSKTYKHRGNHRHKSAKKYWHIYGFEYDDWEEEWSMFCEQVSWLKAQFSKLRKYKRIKAECPNCGTFYLLLVRSRKDILKHECQNCGEEFGDWL